MGCSSHVSYHVYYMTGDPEIGQKNNMTWDGNLGKSEVESAMAGLTYVDHAVFYSPVYLLTPKSWILIGS